MSSYYMLMQDGQPVLRGLTREKAEREAEKRAKKFEGHVAGTRQRVPEYAVRPDDLFTQAQNANLQWWRENRGTSHLKYHKVRET